MYVNVDPDPTPEQVNDVWRLLEEFQDIFTKQPGCTSLAEHKIDVTAKQPICVKPYPMLYAKQKEVDEEVKKMLEAGVIENHPVPATIRRSSWWRRKTVQTASASNSGVWT